MELKMNPKLKQRLTEIGIPEELWEDINFVVGHFETGHYFTAHTSALLFEHYRRMGIMPYGVQKCRDEDCDDWMVRKLREECHIKMIKG